MQEDESLFSMHKVHLRYGASLKMELKISIKIKREPKKVITNMS